MDILGTLGWKTEVDPSGAERDIARTEAEIRAAMERIDRMRATAEAELDTKGLDRDIARVRGELAALDRRQVDIEVRLEDDTLDKGWRTRLTREFNENKKQIRELRVQSKELTAERGKHILKEKEIKNLLAQQERIQRDQEQLLKRITKQREMAEAAERRMAVTHSRALREDERMRSRAETDQRRMMKLQSQAAREDEDRLVRLARLQQQYTRARERQVKLESFGERVYRSPGEVAELNRVNAETAALRREIQRLGGSFEDIDDHVHRARNSLIPFMRNLGQTRVHIGFLSTNLKNFTFALGALSPIVTGVVGYLGSLAAVLGGGIAGGLGLAGAGLTGFGLATFGVVAAIKPYTTQLGSAIELTNKYTEAVRKYGAGSDKAKTAQENMNDALKRMPPYVRESARQFAQLKARFLDMTKGLREPFFATVESALKAGNRLMPMYARNINEIGHTAAGAFSQAFARLGGPEMRNALNQILGNFNRAIPGLVHGMTSLSIALGNIFASFSRHFPSLAGGFDKWAGSLLNATRNTGALNARVDSFVGDFRELVDLLGSAGSLLLAFADAGDEVGRSNIAKITDKFDEWTREMNNDPSGVNDWLEKATNTAERFYHAIQPIAEVFLDISEALRPVTDGLLAIVDAASSLAAALAGTGVGGALMTGLGALMGGRLLYRIGSGMKNMAVSTIPMFVGGLGRGGVAAGKFGTAASKATTSTAKFSNTTTAASRTAASSGSIFARTAGSAGMLGSSLIRGASAFTRFLGPAGFAISTGLLLADAFGLFGDEVEEGPTRLEQFNSKIPALVANLHNQAGGLLAVRAAAIQYGAALQQGGAVAATAALQWRSAFQTARQEAEEARTVMTRGWKAANDAMWGEATNFSGVMEGLRDADWGLGNKFGEFYRSLQRNGRVTKEWAAVLNGIFDSNKPTQWINEALHPYSKGVVEARKLTTGLTQQLINFQRQSKFGAGSGLAKGALHDLQRVRQMFGQRNAIKWSVQLDSSQAQGKMLRLIRQAGNLGAKKQVMKIMADDSDPQTKLKKLQGLVRNRKAEIRVSVQDKGVRGVLAGLATAVGRLHGRKATVQVRQQGAQETQQQIDGINRTNLKPKRTRVSVQNEASPALRGIAGEIAALPSSKTITITTQYRTVGSPPGHARGTDTPVPAYAGGTAAAERGGFFKQPTYIVGEQPGAPKEVVISGNPAYRSENRKYLMSAARMLGMGPMLGAFAKGYQPSRRLRVGGVSEDAVQRRLTKAENERNHYKDRVNNLKDRIDNLRDAYRDLRSESHSKDPKTRSNARERRAEIQKRIAAWMPSLDAARDNLKGANVTYQRRREDLRVVKRANARITHAREVADRWGQVMTEAESKGQVGRWRHARGERIEALNALERFLRRAVGAAGEPLKTQLQTQLSAARTDEQDAKESRPDAETFMLSPAQRDRLTAIETARSRARLTADPTDDQRAMQSLITFWERRYGESLREYGKGHRFTGYAAEQLASAREAAGLTASGGAGDALEQAAGFNEQRMALYRAFGGNVMWMGRQGVGSYRESGASGGPTGNTVTINQQYNTPPEDPHAWSQQVGHEVRTVGL